MAISVLSTPDTAAGFGDPLPEVVRLPEEFPEAVALNRTALRVVQMTDYTYAVPARQVVTQVRLLPPPLRGWQHRRKHQLQVAPLSHTTFQQTDGMGNEYWEAHHERVESHLTFAVQLEMTTHCAYTEDGLPLPTPIPARSGESPQVFRTATGRTTPDDALQEAAKAVCQESGMPRPSLRLFAALGDHVHRMMHFDSKATGIGTGASEAWHLGRGVCQDYSHITLVLCRLCGIAARYVSGFVPGEGVMHAWVEAWLPIRIHGKTKEFWFAYDPTYNKWVDDNYVTVAVGRDYGDITPTSGTYYGGSSVLKYRNKVTVLQKKIYLL